MEATDYALQESLRIQHFLRLKVDPRESGLSVIAAMLSHPAQPLCVKAEELDEIVAGEDLEYHQSENGDAFYMEGLYARLGWWSEVAEGVAWGRQVSLTPHPDFKPQREKVLQLFKETLSKYGAAFAATERFSDFDKDEPAHTDLLKSYRLFTRCVCDFAAEVWPEVDFAKLYEQV